MSDDAGDDLALETLLPTRDAVAPDIELATLRQCYLIQRRHQFDADRTFSSKAMERLIDETVAAEPEGARGKV